MAKGGVKGKSGRRQSIRKPDAREIQEFEDEVERCIEDLDWALRMYSLTLQEAGIDEKGINERMRQLMLRTIKKCGS